MARRKTKRRRSRKKYFSLYDGAVAYGNLAILTSGALGVSPFGFISGEEDIGQKSVYSANESGWGGSYSMQTYGGDAVTLRDFIASPSLSMESAMANASANAIPMATNAIFFNVGASVLKKVLKVPIRNSNRMIRKLGLGVQI